MPLENMGPFETFCRFLPFYPSVYLGRVITQATNILGKTYAFDSIAGLGLIPLGLFMTASIIFSFLVFQRKMHSDS